MLGFTTSSRRCSCQTRDDKDENNEAEDDGSVVLPIDDDHGTESIDPWIDKSLSIGRRIWIYVAWNEHRGDQKKVKCDYHHHCDHDNKQHDQTINGTTDSFILFIFIYIMHANR